MTGLVYLTWSQLASNAKRNSFEVGTKLCVCAYADIYYVSSWLVAIRYVSCPFPALLHSVGWLLPESYIPQYPLSAGFLLGFTRETVDRRKEEATVFSSLSLHLGPSSLMALSLLLLGWPLNRPSARLASVSDFCPWPLLLLI